MNGTINFTSRENWVNNFSQVRLFAFMKATQIPGITREKLDVVYEQSLMFFPKY